MTTPPLTARVAGAPISWGVCEAPDWGVELSADRVLAEMQALGLRATELGPTGFLGATPEEVKATLLRYDLRMIGGFLPVTMHLDPRVDLTDATAAIATLAAAGAEVVVFAAQSADGSYDHKVQLDDAEWTVLLETLQRLQEIAGAHGLRSSVHPHVGTAIEDRASVLRLLDSSDTPICLDTGHLLIGGMQPLELLAKAAGRVSHVHLKDVSTSVAASVSAGTTSYIDAVRAGLYTPLGEGDLDIAAVVRTLEQVGYSGWYVLEQDAALYAEPAAGTGPVDDVRRSIEFLTATAG
ncbi:MAG: TIM barrel protein [Jatrophihabitans sp.]